MWSPIHTSFWNSTFNSLTDSHNNIRSVLESLAVIDFQFPNGFSHIYIEVWQSEKTDDFQFPNGFSLDAEDIEFLQALTFNSLTDSHTIIGRQL